MKLLPKLTEVLDRIEAEAEVSVPLDASPIDILCAVYTNPNQPMHRRMLAAIEAAPYLHAKLSVTANVGAKDFALQLEQAIKRSGKAVTIEHVHADAEPSAS
jgi:hypothetical protein